LDTSKLKLKVSVTYSWEEEVDPREYEYISDIKKHYILTGAYKECINKLDTRADNCLPDNYKCSIDLNWEE